MNEIKNHCYEFGAFRLDPAEHALLHDGQVVHLPPKAFETLLVLIEHHGHLVEKDELLDEVWSGSFVEEANVAKHVSILRKLFSGYESQEPFIVTVPKHGYRFVAPIHEIDLESNGHGKSRSSNGREIETASPRSSPFLRHAVFQITQHKIVSLLALAILVVGVTAGANYFFLAESASVLTDRDVILLADVENRTGEEIFDGTIKQGLLIQLRQSPFLSILPDSEVRDTLKLMKRSPDERVTREIGREICQRIGIKALIVGTVVKLDRNYSVTLEAIDAETGDSLVITQTQAEGKDGVFGALSNAVTEIRAKLGESLASIETFDKPLKRVTTPSLEAFKAFTMALEMHSKGDRKAAITLFEKAIKIDPEFALAYAYLGNQYDNRRIDLQLQMYLKAYRLRDKVSEREKVILDEYFYGYILMDVDKKLELMKIGKVKYPRDLEIRMAIVRAYFWLGQYEEVVAEAREMSNIDPGFSGFRGHLTAALKKLGRFDEAKETIRKYSQVPDDLRDHLYQIVFVENDSEELHRILESIRKDDKTEVLLLEAAVAGYRGQWRRARGLTDPVIENFIEADSRVSNIQAGQRALWSQMLRAADLGQCRQAKTWGSEILAEGLQKRAGALTARIANALAKCGDLARGQAVISELVKKNPSGTLKAKLWLPIITAEIAFQNGEPEKAIRLMQETEPYERAAGYLTYDIKGRAYLELNENEKAAREFQKILDQRGLDVFSVLYPLAQLGKARAMKDKREYELFFNMWKDADSDLPVLIAAKREYNEL